MSTEENITLQYPVTRRDETVFAEFHGEKVADPYRWLETPDTDEINDWFNAQEKTTTSFLKQVSFRDELCKRLTEAWNYEKMSSPFVEGDYQYWFHNSGLQNQSVMYRKKLSDVDNTAIEAEVFLDPNTFSEKGTSSLAAIEFTKDASLCAYFISHAGSDLRECKIINTTTKEEIEPALQYIKFSPIVWYKNEGFFYSKYHGQENIDMLIGYCDSHRVFYHRLNTKQSEDVEIFGHKENQKRRYVGPAISEDFAYLITYAATATSGNELYIKKLTSDNVANDADVKCLIDNFENDFDYVDCYDNILYLLTNYKAPLKRLIALDLNKFYALDDAAVNNNVMTYHEAHPEAELIKEIIPETAEDVLESVSTAGGLFVANYLNCALSKPKLYTTSGEKLVDIELPGPGTASGFSAKRKETAAYYSFASYTSPSAIYKFDLKTYASTLHFTPKVKIDGLSDFVSKQIIIKSADRDVPMIITYNPNKVDLSSGKAYPTMLYAYGGFNITLSPAFSVPIATWVALGGIYVVANLSGDGHFGKKSHLLGTKTNKQNVFDDFIACAEYLIAQKYTDKDHLAIHGGSNGGLLAAATVLQRPDLFRASIPAVGVLDMLSFARYTSGSGWQGDYGDVNESPEMFKYLLSYSPLHNVKEQAYPAILVTTGSHDDRVSPAHSFKFIAELQSKSLNVKEPEKYKNSPNIILVARNAGHGAGKSTTQMISERADIFAFALYAMGIKQLE